MDRNEKPPALQEQVNARLRTLRSHRDREPGGESEREAAANGSNQRPQPIRRRSTRTRPVLSSPHTIDSGPAYTSSVTYATAEDSTTANQNIASQPDLSARNHHRTRLGQSSVRALSRRGIDSAVGSPSRRNLSPMRASSGVEGAPALSQHETDLSIALEHDLLEDNLLRNNASSSLLHARMRPNTLTSFSGTSRSPETQTSFEAYVQMNESFDNYDSEHATSIYKQFRSLFPEDSDQSHHTVSGSSKRARDKSEREDQDDLSNVLKKHGAVTALLYRTTEPDHNANDIWPDFRNKARLPAHYSILNVNRKAPAANTPNERPQAVTQNRYELRGQAPDAPTSQLTAGPCNGRPFWQLPVELVEHIIEYLNRDDIKALRLVSRELNEYTSQAAFKTVVVPFNTEIYGMLGQEPKADRKGKKRAKISRPEYCWKNANGDEVYNGHGLDVFRGFGRHILRYGMSFVVSEDSLSAPPLKPVTEEKTSFWGNYEWPFEEYRRFEAVAGLEFAADETPRMKTAFSELTKVKELALSVDSGLGWLNGPDRSIRARILQTSPSIFGSRQHIPDRRTQAQRELWNHIESMHASAGEDIRLASLFRFEGTRPWTEAQEAKMMATTQPSLPFLDANIPYEALPHDATDSSLPHSKGDSEMRDHHVLASPSANVGVLFTSTTSHHNDAAQILSPVVPAKLSNAQKEWLLETEWAQRAFMSSYMLSIIDNQTTFAAIHTLNISSLSDRYVSMLNRTDFWEALPCLENVTLMVIPGWRTVEKDEAGFVAAPRVDPTGHVDTFRKLLEAQVAPRSRITKLTIGYTASGEHAEGSHARNKLLMPAPILPLRARMQADLTLPPLETATVQDANILQRFLLRFQHLEELTLRNCWVTPSALLQFVKIHDGSALKRLNLESVSLTALLQTTGNAQAANIAPAPFAGAVQPMAGALMANANNNVAANPPAANQILGNGQALNNHLQILVAQVQQIQANAPAVQQHQHFQAILGQLQHQMQNAQALALHQPQVNAPLSLVQQSQQAQMLMQLNHLAHQVTLLQAIVANQNAPAAGLTDDSTGDTDSILQARPRTGSWMDIIDQISPGTNLSDFGSNFSQADADRTTCLESISFVSCGYAKLPHIALAVDQTAVEVGNGALAALRNAVFTKRHNALSPSMMSSKWQYLGEIVQEVDLRELAALDAGWNLRVGWDDAGAAHAVEFDGLLPGGTGRFSGTVQRSDKVSAEADSAT
ncbi:hypothetical protein C7974DRAFT_383727 [Boeremia exigua]|uniref:uncharacterized protein n=1 Tax=Boeremia exigua TaxID=749465 RepID=UPI001E8E2320|nr:uncharacterized protein C7974DRAFT_383727 [Boeremia exigua]KAH6644529.1 hypothetical protein C7974DRAFT_383727 [Boeremia exigua]